MEITDHDEPKPKMQKIETDKAAEVCQKGIIVAERGDQLPSESGIDIGPNTGVVAGGGDSSDCIFKKFFNDVETYEFLMSSFEFLVQNPYNAFVPLVICLCDAASNQVRFGKPFSECECVAINDVNKFGIKTLFPFGAFFTNSFEIYDSLKVKKIPSDPRMKKTARKLLTYIMEEKEWHKELMNLKETEYVTSETQVMVTLAEHFFKRLTVVNGYRMDKHSKKESSCKCAKCDPRNLKFDDTSIGNKEVWHGNLDLVFDSCDIALKVTSEVEDESPGERSHVEFKKLDDLNSYKSRSQILAQTIVFSFLQKQKHPGSNHFLFPCFIADNNSFKVFCYDAQHDVLLESRIFEFSSESKVNFDAAIAAWLVLNHQLLCTGVFPECLEKAPKSKFREFAGDSLDIYENELCFRNVPQVSNVFKVKTFKDWSSLHAVQNRLFVWPESVRSLGTASK